MEPNNNIGIVELIDRTLNKGVILNADLIITVADIPLLAANLKLALASVETMLKYGVMNDWLEPVSLNKSETKPETKEEIAEVVLNELHELKKKEEAELEEWQNKIDNIKEKLNLVDNNLFSA